MARNDKSDPRFNAPFRDLDKRLRSLRRSKPEKSAAPSPRDTVPASCPEPAPDPETDATIFDRAMRGVTPLDRGRRRPPGPKRAGAVPGRAPVDEDGETYARLAGLVSGEAPFDITETGEYVEGFVPDFDRRELRRLRAGEISVRDELDLHHMTSEEARAALDRFILGAVARRLSCVRVVHGRGLHSKEEGPVLKEKVIGWLSGRRLGKVVLAFTSARPVDGGTGALYVLLRKRPRP